MLKRHKTKLVAALVIVAVLTGAWFYSDFIAPSTEIVELPMIEAAAEYIVSPTPTEAPGPREQSAYEEETSDEIDANEPAETSADAATPPPTPAPTPTEAPQATPTPIPTPPPVAPTPEPTPDASFTVTLAVRVDTILNNLHLLSGEKHELVPPNGVIFGPREVTAYPGESVFDVLQREMREAGIHMSSRWTPVFNSAYVEAINNLFEFDVGPLSGWMFRVNGWFPNFGASQYELSPGDVIEWHYTVDLDRDLGAPQG
jgi:hypothetical protein